MTQSELEKVAKAIREVGDRAGPYQAIARRAAAEAGRLSSSIPSRSKRDASALSV